MHYFLLALIFLISPILSANNDSDTLHQKLQAMQTMSARFKQVVRAKKKVVSRSSGKMALSRPGKFRWHTTAPMEQLVVADSNKLWVYDVELEQVTVKKQDKSVGGTAALFLSGHDDTLKNDFDVTLHQIGKKDVFDLVAKDDQASFSKVQMVFQSGKLLQLKLYDQLGQLTDVHMSRIKNNPKLAQKLFKFKPPKGVDVVKQ